MKFSQFLLPILKDNPSDAVSLSHSLMLKSGMIKQNFSGIYTMLPLAQRVLEKIQKIIDFELGLFGCLKVSMPIIQDQKLWDVTQRSYGQETLRMKDRHGNDLLFSPTAEEMAVVNLKSFVKSYKDLPINIYQIGSKFRDEIRPRFGLMRAREFLMMDSYSFDIDQASSYAMYYKIYQAYNNIFKKIGVTAIPMLADTGEIGGDLSHEFHILSKTGETEIFYDENILSINFNDLSFEEIKKIAAFTEEKKENRNLSDYKSARGIEVGQIFYIGKKYTQALDFKVQDKDMQLVHPEMATFGIGVGRLMAAVIEASHDEDGIIWPESIAPFDFVLINANGKNQELKDASELIYSSMIASGKEVLYDDTDKTFGEKMKNADLIGVPNKIIVGKNWLEGNLIEIKNRKTKDSTLLTLEQLMQF